MPKISPIDPISFSITCTQLIFFRPFERRKWFRIAFVATLFLVGEGGFDLGNFIQSGRAIAENWEKIWPWVQAHMPLFITLATLLVVFFTTIYLLGRWLGSRATFVFFDNVVKDDHRVREPWEEFRSLGKSLFKFRLLMDLVAFNASLLILIIVGIIAWPDIKASLIAGEFLPRTPTLVAGIFGILAFILWSIVWWIASWIVLKLAVPVMYLRRMEAWPAVKETYRRYFRPNWGACILFFLMLVVVMMARSIWVGLAALAFLALTLCMGILVFIIPIVGIYPAVLGSLPIFAFERIYLLTFISQFDSALEVPWHGVPATGFPIAPDSDLFP